MAWLDDNPPVRSQFRRPRRESPSGVVVVHTAENAPDTAGSDSGAENVANFIRNRTDPGSYHDLADSDSCINLVGYDAEAFHDATGSNPHSYGVSGATQAAKWASMPQAWRDGCVRQMAAAASRYARWLRSRTGIVIPARRITRAQSEARVPGFISHAERDPARRTDPGANFPWAQFLDLFAQFTDQKEDFDMDADEAKALFREVLREEIKSSAFKNSVRLGVNEAARQTDVGALGYRLDLIADAVTGD